MSILGRSCVCHAGAFVFVRKVQKMPRNKRLTGRDRDGVGQNSVRVDAQGAGQEPARAAAAAASVVAVAAAATPAAGDDEEFDVHAVVAQTRWQAALFRRRKSKLPFRRGEEAVEVRFPGDRRRRGGAVVVPHGHRGDPGRGLKAIIQAIGDVPIVIILAGALDALYFSANGRTPIPGFIVTWGVIFAISVTCGTPNVGSHPHATARKVRVAEHLGIPIPTAQISPTLTT